MCRLLYNYTNPFTPFFNPLVLFGFFYFIGMVRDLVAFMVVAMWPQKKLWTWFEKAKCRGGKNSLTCVVHSEKWPPLEINEKYAKNTVIGVVFGDEFLAQGLHLKSHQSCSAGIRTWLSADQSSSSTLTESSFLFNPCLIYRDTVMIE